MKGKIAWLVVSCLMVLALLVASCAKVEEAAPAVKEAAPAVKETAPVVKETAPAAAEAPRYGGTLVFIAGTTFADIWDPSYSRNPPMYANEGLLIGDWAKGDAGSGKYPWTYGGQDMPEESMAGLLAESWEFPDDTTIIYHLRKGVRWVLDPNNAASRLVGGRELTADDIVWNIKWIYWQPRTPQYTQLLGGIPTDVYATDKYTVVCKIPSGYLGMAWEAIGHMQRTVAPEIQAKYGDYLDWKNNVGTGPFILRDVVPMSSTSWVRNPNYYLTDPVGPGKGNQLPYFDGLKQLLIPDMSTRMAALRTGRIDQDSTSFSAEDAKSLRKTSPQLKYVTYQGGIPLIGMRVDGYKPGLPWAGSVPYFPSNPSPADVNALKVRRALNLAVNKQEILDTIYGGEGTTLGFYIVASKAYEGIYTPLDQLPEDSRELFESHPDKAKQLLAEAGYPNGFKVHAYVGTHMGSGSYLDIAIMIKEYWRKIGVDLEVRPINASTWTSMQLKVSYEEIFFNGTTAYGVTKMYGCSPGNVWNSSRESDPKLQYYYMKMSSLFRDVPKRNAVMKELNLYVIPFAWYVYPPAGVVYTFWQPWLKNYHGEQRMGHQNGYEWMYAWIDQPLRKAMARR